MFIISYPSHPSFVADSFGPLLRSLSPPCSGCISLCFWASLIGKGETEVFFIAILVRPLDVQAKRLTKPSLSQCPFCQTESTTSPDNRRKGKQTKTYLDAPSVRHLPNGRAPSPSCQCERQINNLRLATAPVPHLPNEKAPRASCNKSTIIRGL